MKIKFWLIGLGLILLFLTRFYNLNLSARFIWDESSDLVRMNELYKNFRLTMIGPMSEDGVKVFGSLTYYLTLPFVILFKFSPVSAAYATAFFGILTVIILLLIYKKNKISTPLIYFFSLLLVSYPLVEASRWAWNPHFIPFWQSLGLFSFLTFGNIGMVLSGLFFGLTIHHHYYGLFAAIGFLFVLVWKRKTKLKNIFLYLAGLGLAILPFVLFDLTHPPGLFYTRMIGFSPLSYGNGAFNLKNILTNLSSIPWNFMKYMTGSKLLFSWIVLVLSVVNIFKLKKDQSQKWLLVVIVQFLGLSMISGGVFDHYLLPAVIFYYLWITTSYKKSWISRLLVYTLIISNIILLPSLIYKNDWSTNIKATEDIAEYVIFKCDKDCKNFNLVVLKSPDPNTKGRRYRDLLKLKNIELTSMDKYSDLDGIFVISYANWGDLKSDPSYEINDYRNMFPIETKTIKNSQWKIYFFDRNK